MIKRTIQHRVEDCFFKGKIVIISGARQVGKTTLIKEIERRHRETSLYLNCDEPDIRESLTDATSTELRTLIGRKRLIFIDEAQRVRNIGLTLKLLADNFSDLQVVATGSSSLDLSNEIAEPLTGRKLEFQLYPFSLAELAQEYSTLELKRLLEKRVVMGMYPEIQQKPDEAEALLKSVATSYLYQDVLQYQDVRRPELLERLLAALALQLGSQVSLNELSNLLGVAKNTVATYIHLLEHAFVIFRLRPFGRNPRKELTKLNKIYFVDTGIRNALIQNLNPTVLRQDTGQLWENFMISERMKRNANAGITANTYFWRTHQQQEMDYIEERDGRLFAFEFKWQNRKARIPKTFRNAYPDAETSIIDTQNFPGFVGLE